jgi:hypothetical protein
LLLWRPMLIRCERFLLGCTVDIFFILVLSSCHVDATLVVAASDAGASPSGPDGSPVPSTGPTKNAPGTLSGEDAGPPLGDAGGEVDDGAWDSSADGAPDSGGSAFSDAEGGAIDAGYDQVTINFDDLPNAATVTNQYGAHASFSSEAGHFNTTQARSEPGSSPPNYLCASQSAGVCGFNYATYVDFARPVGMLSFHAIGVQTAHAKFGQVRVSYAGGTVDVDMVNPSANSYVVVDLSMYDLVNRIEITNTDPAGIGLDDFLFEFPR